MINYTKHVLKNGLRVFLAPKHETEAVTILYLVGVGSRFETDQQSGLSHFLEHMMFKGTEKRPDSLAITKELDRLGASYNAYTSEEATGYYVSTAGEHFPIALETLTDMLLNSKFEDAEIAKEKGVITEEIKMYNDSPTGYLGRVAKTLAFGDTPLGRDIAGTAGSIGEFDADKVREYYTDHYTTDNMVLVVAGNPAGHHWQEQIEKLLADLPTGPKSEFITQHMPEGTAVSVGHKPIDQAHLVLMHYSYPRDDDRHMILDVIDTILGATMSSRLFLEIREKRGLAYYVRTNNDLYHDISTFDCLAGVDPLKLPLAVSTIVDELEKLKTEPVTEEELAWAISNIKGVASLGLETSDSIARFIAKEATYYKRFEQPEEYIKRVEKVSQSDIMKTAQELFTAKNRKLAVVGPLEKEKEAELLELIK